MIPHCPSLLLISTLWAASASHLLFSLFLTGITNPEPGPQMSKNTPTFQLVEAVQEQPLPAVMEIFPHQRLGPAAANTRAIESNLEERLEQMWLTCGWLSTARQCYVACRKDDSWPYLLRVRTPTCMANFTFSLFQCNWSSVFW